MPAWTLIDTHPVQGRTFQRPLDALELWFFWNGLFNGGTDGLQYCELCLLNGSQDARLFSEANITRAWLSTKRRYPLTGATVRGADNAPLQMNVTTNSKVGHDTGFASAPHFVVQECDLTSLRPSEIIFGSVSCAKEAQGLMSVIMNGPRPLSPELLMQLYVFRETHANRADVLHLMILVAHCVTDRLAISTFLRCLLDTLARGEGAEPAQIPLEQRLGMEIPSMDLKPKHLQALSPATRRWRRAVGTVLFQLRTAKQQGGHTLPCRLTQSTPNIAARSGLVSTSLSHTQTAAVIANCRLHGVTFGSAYLVLAQVAMTRVLYRRYLRGEISEEEWTYRKKQPCLGGGPLNLRPHLDKAWFEKGGGGEPMLSLGLFLYQLPFMTTGKSEQRVLSDGAPPFSELLTFERLLHRAESIKKQATSFSNHPLFFDIMHAIILEEIKHTQHGALEWMKRVDNANGHHAHGKPDDEVLAAMDIPMVWGFGGSTVGNLDLMSPTKYPLPPTHPLSPYSFAPHPIKAGYVTPPLPFVTAKAETTTKVVVENSRIHIHARPSELYPTADCMNGQMNLYVFYDENVFEEEVIKEWSGELKEAVLWYLGQTHQPRQAQEQRGGGGKFGLGADERARL